MYELMVSLIGPVPIEFEFIYGLATLVGSIFGIIAIFSSLILVFKLVD